MNARKLMALAAICVATASSTSWAADMTISTDQVLDDDLTVDGTLTVASGATVDLDGHKLSVKGLAGAGSITDSNQSYELLDYIEATGAQRIDTDIIPGANTAVDVVATATDLASYNQTLFGAAWGAYYLCFAQNTTWYCLYNKSFSDPSLKGNRRRVVVGSGTATVYDGKTGAVIGTTQPSFSNTSGKVLSICGHTDNNQYGYWRIHSFKIWHESVLRYDLVPVRKSATGEVGLLNRVDGTLHKSATATDFIAGPVGANICIEASSEAALANFSGTVDPSVGISLQGDCVLSSDADWRRFPTLYIDGTVDLAGHDLSLSDLRGTGGITDSTDEYDRLEYVESTANQVVNTGIVPSTDTAVELDATYLTSGDGTALFGCDEWSAKRYMFVFTASKLYFFGAGKNFGAPANGTRYIVSVTPSTSPNGKIKVVNKASGALMGSEQTDTLASNNTELRLFGFGSNTRMGKWRLHSFKMWKGGDLKRDLVPVRHGKTGKVGLLDKVSGYLFTSATSVDLVAGPVVTTAGSPGHLRIDVSAGRTVKTEFLPLSGSLTLVKEGTGTLVANRTGQMYTGGTHIEGGLVEAMYRADSDPLGKHGASGGAGPDIIIGSGAVFDFKANFNYRYYNIVLDGGTIRNAGSDMAQNSGSLGDMTLTADSFIETEFNTTVFDARTVSLYLGSHTLTAETMGKTLYFRDPLVITNGTFWTKGTGCLYFNSTVNARSATLRVESALWLGAKVDVDDYYAACTFDSNNGTAAMNVYGRFTPATDYFYGCTLQDGATLDLNGRNGAWSTTSAFTSGANRVTFASGAAITLDASMRPTFKGKIVDWGTGNTPSDVAFRLDAASKAMGRALRVKDDGLYAVGGVMIIVR